MAEPTFRRALLLGLFSSAILASEIALTRIFSVVFWYHFGFLILSTSLLGFALGGLLIRLWGDRLRHLDPDRLIAASVTAGGGLLVLSLFVITHNHFSPLFINQSFRELAKLVVTSLALVPPFTVMGGAVLYMLQQWPRQVGRLYAANLLGSGLGCLLVLWLMDWTGGLNACLLAAASMPLMAAVYIAPGNRKAALAVAGVGLALLLTIPKAAGLFPLETPSGKPAGLIINRYAVIFNDWTSLSKVDIVRADIYHSQGYGLWGLSPKNDARLPERLGAVIDYWAYTTIIRHKDEPGYYDFFHYLPMYMAYKLVERPKTLIIGAGGGMDVRAALISGAERVDAVEINPSIVRVMTGELADYSGDIYRQPGVEIHLAEGRSFVESSEEVYDLIQLSGVDTYSATQAGAFTLSENFLYTKEAMAAYLDHLADHGLLTLTRWYMPSPEGLPRFSMRLFVLAVESLAALGYENPWENIVFFRSGAFTVILIKKSPFTDAELETIDAEVQKREYAFLFRPDMDLDEEPSFYGYVKTPDRRQWLEDYPFNVSAPTDDSPFFFEHRKMRNICKFQAFLPTFSRGLDGQSILAILMIEMVLAALALLGLSYRLHKGRGRPAAWTYFAAIGLGFMLVEVTLSQRLILFLGHPAYALSVVMFAVLVFSGLGSLFSARLENRFPAWAGLLAVAALLVVLAFGVPPLLRALIDRPLGLRMVTAVALMAPVAFLMGTAFPAAVRRLTEAGERELGLYWAWNGVASVTASVLAVIVAMGTGFSMVLMIAAGCYVLAGACLSRLAGK